STIEAADVVFRLVIGPAVAMAAELLVVAGVVIVLLLTAPGVTIVAVVLLFALLALLVRTTRQALTRWGKQEHMMREQTLKTLHQTLEGYKEVKLRGREEFFQHRFGEQHDAMNSVRHRFMTLSSVSRLFVETVFIIGLLGVVVLVTLTSDGKVELIPVLGVYAYAGFRIIPSVNRILLHISNIRYGLPAVDLVSRDLKACEAAPELASGLSNGEHVLAFRQRLDIEDVSFSYPNSTAAVLRRLNLSFACGESVGIVGPTGAGKSTLVNIVLGLLTPSAGRILVDGVDIQSVLPNWQRKIGYVPQSVYLIDDSLRRNIAFAVAEDEIDDSRIQRALKRAQLEAFVAGLPRGLDTVIGERGVRLSGGERQRVAIARALYYEPELLVFDEATSSLDMRTERDLTSAIESLHGQKTMLIVAHRLSTVRNCDRLVFLRNNDDVAVGSYEDLISNCTDFRTMAAGGSASEQTGTPAA
ncbi:MAG TPA: ABC transporter ATP-binding protein, partial [Candidatus Acidoferrales bacterium]|nr:ABC transporter ATP-binding protein [Candidatus Acidoferrales bacterium]